MKLLQPLAIMGALLLSCPCSVHAQSGRAPHVASYYYGKRSAKAPVLRRTRGNYAYMVAFPGAGRTTVRIGIDKPDGTIIQDRAEIVPGVQIRIPDQKKWLNGEPEPPPSIAAAGRKLNVDFGRYLSDSTIWTHAVLNNTTYQLGRGYFKKDAYWYFGLVEAHGKTYVGVCWYSMGSAEGDTLALVLRLDWTGTAIEPTPVRALPDIPTSAEFPLALDSLSNGDLVVSGGGKLLEMNTMGEWKQAPAAFLKDNARLGAYSAYWRRGSWLLFYHQEYLGQGAATNIHVVVQQAATRRNVEAFTWTVATR